MMNVECGIVGTGETGKEVLSSESGAWLRVRFSGMWKEELVGQTRWERSAGFWVGGKLGRAGWRL